MRGRAQRHAQVGIDAMNAALSSLGMPPIGDPESDIQFDEPDTYAPQAVLDAPGAAPMRFIFGPLLDVWIGPFSEVLVMDVERQTTSEIEEELTCLFTSQVAYRYRRGSVRIALSQPEQKPWRRLGVSGGFGVFPRLEPLYAPYVVR